MIKIEESRTAKISINKVGGTASVNSVNHRVTLPNLWVKQLGITKDDRDVVITLIDNKIVIEKKL